MQTHQSLNTYGSPSGSDPFLSFLLLRCGCTWPSLWCSGPCTGRAPRWFVGLLPQVCTLFSFASQLVQRGSVAGSAGLQAWSAPSCPGASQGFLESHLCLCLQGVTPEDFSNFPPEQRRKKLQQKVDDLNKEIQKETDQR